MRQNVFKNRVVRPLAGLLSQGMPAGRIAISMAVGLALSVIPILGVTTGLCLVAAFAFRLNVAAMQLVNWLATPLQLALLLPFYQFGARLAGLTPVSITPASLREALRVDPFGLLESLWQQMLAGTALWLALSLPAIWLFARAFRALLHRIEPAGALHRTHARAAFASTVGGP